MSSQKSRPAYVSNGQALSSPPLSVRLNRFTESVYLFLGLYFHFVPSIPLSDQHADTQPAHSSTPMPPPRDRSSTFVTEIPRLDLLLNGALVPAPPALMSIVEAPGVEARALAGWTMSEGRSARAAAEWR
ncbi:hypothetical protein PEBR_43337 [Penicillium brasilianum]|uniref:Uncharacterized protein n=1 Tax=Penicillium brasilianum TaxID=104259 RepID=A0A1S9R955_PENBI|nr:hypothetical protein PEBR_43337 [Penicillium brasilianum]